MRALLKLIILFLFIMVLMYGDSYSQDKYPGLVNVPELKNRLLSELKSDGFEMNGEYSITYNFLEDILMINNKKSDKHIAERYKDIILDYYHRDTKGVFIMAKPYAEGNIKGEIIGIKLDD